MIQPPSGVLAVKIGRPGYRVTKQFDSETKQRSLLFQVIVTYFSPSLPNVFWLYNTNLFVAGIDEFCLWIC